MTDEKFEEKVAELKKLVLDYMATLIEEEDFLEEVSVILTPKRRPPITLTCSIQNGEVVPNDRKNKERMNALIKEGTKVWKDVPDAAEWVRKLRDGKL